MGAGYYNVPARLAGHLITENRARVIILEHGLNPDDKVDNWQDAAPVQAGMVDAGKLSDWLGY